MTDDLRVGLAGYGVAGRTFHAPLIESTPGLSLAAVVTRSAERRSALRGERPGVPALDSLDDLLRSGPDVVVLATPSETHVPYALACVEAGVPVVVDKPFAPSPEQARRVMDAARARSVPVTVFQNRRWDGDYLTVRRLLAGNALGRVHRFESRWEFAADVDPARPGGGLLSELGVHLIDQAVQAFGPAGGVYAELASRRPRAAADDDVFVAMTHRSGVLSHLWAGAAVHEPGPRFRVVGEEGCFVIEGLDGQEDALASGAVPGGAGWGVAPESGWGRLVTREGSRSIPTEPGAYQVFYQRLEAALRTGGDVPVDPRSTVDTLAVIEAAVRSARTGQVVPLI
ncbi:Gfo/Idh/MocA family oxidoreductase [Nonomuraea typhae]|uniref:Gfo/Idh/MocA family oxidoreductase n=1 Tax=Nonomuraea typhae TaxID=2603600 RepID=UPI0012FCFC2C|nr:Gfo/Idh/MocA family oxidoreductase [Nonomuraea typhae]